LRVERRRAKDAVWTELADAEDCGDFTLAAFLSVQWLRCASDLRNIPPLDPH